MTAGEAGDRKVGIERKSPSETMHSIVPLDGAISSVRILSTHGKSGLPPKAGRVALMLRQAAGCGLARSE